MQRQNIKRTLKVHNRPAIIKQNLKKNEDSVENDKVYVHPQAT
jgi:hypothetical protein